MRRRSEAKPLPSIIIILITVCDSVYLDALDGLAHGAAVVCLVPAGSVADHADGLVVHRAEELEPLLVQGAHLPRRDGQLAARFPLLGPALLHT